MELMPKSLMSEFFSKKFFFIFFSVVVVPYLVFPIYMLGFGFELKQSNFVLFFFYFLFFLHQIDMTKEFKIKCCYNSHAPTKVFVAN